MSSDLIRDKYLAVKRDYLVAYRRLVKREKIRVVKALWESIIAREEAEIARWENMSSYLDSL